LGRVEQARFYCWALEKHKDIIKAVQLKWHRESIVKHMKRGTTGPEEHQGGSDMSWSEGHPCLIEFEPALAVDEADSAP